MFCHFHVSPPSCYGLSKHFIDLIFSTVNREHEALKRCLSVAMALTFHNTLLATTACSVLSIFQHFQRKAPLTKTRVVTRRQRMASNVMPDDTTELERIITAQITDSLADVIKLSIQQALRNHQPSYHLPVASTSGVEGQEPRPCMVDIALGIVESEGPELSGIHSNISISVASSIP